jgi:addiction module RelE/StbE family toxin
MRLKSLVASLLFSTWQPVTDFAKANSAPERPRGLTGCYAAERWHTVYGIYTIFSMWEVYEHRRVDKQLGKLSTDVLKRYEKWKDIVELSGPSGLKLIRGFRDEALRGDWKGYRSSRLNQQYRVIYRVEGDQFLVEVVEVNPHDYRRKT